VPTPQTFDVEITTPALPGGPDPKNASEFEGVRPTSIVYGMRWWFRALAGAVLGANALPEIRNSESLLFGTSQKLLVGGVQQDALRSRLRISVSLNVDPLQCRAFEPTDPASKYLAYGLYPTNRSENWVRTFIPPDQKFQFEVLTLKARDKEPPIPENLVRTLAELWIEFGGLGARWRHGLGAMSIATRPLPAPENYAAETRNRLAAAHSEITNFLATLGLHPKPQSTQSQIPQFPIALDPFLKIAWGREAGSDWRAVLQTIYKLWRADRLQKPDWQKNTAIRTSTVNASLFADFMRGTTVTGHPAQLAGLGLPIPFGFPQGADGIAPRSAGTLQPANAERRASPVWLRPIKVARGKLAGFGILAMLWQSQYLDDADTLILTDSKNNQPTQTVTLDVTDAVHWFDHFLLNRSNGFQRVETSQSPPKPPQPPAKNHRGL
jgi:CRISPR type III-B/RAMP module RAMP protein Cmr1